MCGRCIERPATIDNEHAPPGANQDQGRGQAGRSATDHHHVELVRLCCVHAAERLRIVIGEHDLVLGAGEVAEFDTGVPHWFGSDGKVPAEILSILGKQGEKMHVRAKPTPP